MSGTTPSNAGSSETAAARWWRCWKVLFLRDLTDPLPRVALVFSASLILEISLWMTPWARDPEMAKLLFELVGIVCVAALPFLIVLTQSSDLDKARLRHLLSLPITPGQVILSKMMAFCLASWVILLAVNSLWFLGRFSEGGGHGIEFTLRATLDMWLASLMLWSFLTLVRQVGTWVVVLAVAALIGIPGTVPDLYQPMSLALPLEPAGGSRLWARLIATLVIAAAAVINERYLAKRAIA